MNKRITIRKKNSLRKAEIPIIAIGLFYFFLFYSMSSGKLSVMITELFSFENGIIGLTMAILGFMVTVLLNMLQVSKISLTNDYLIASPRLGSSKKFLIQDLEMCRIKWYDGKDRRYPFFQFNFNNGKMFQIIGHHYTGLKPLILHLRDSLRDKLNEIQ